MTWSALLVLVLRGSKRGRKLHRMRAVIDSIIIPTLRLPHVLGFPTTSNPDLALASF